ncbi:hypothetical protein D081_1801 [Anaerovibrio sp. JC8]|uniref:hypothetical protein n=1 Tax=Anaerovibrio sp. JC8 TaxID=1240085 RepID=UPI000A0E8124|nr:hypothetical protein [Anaerovibrio sp. JC8]ORT99651.1 hypothetical protein D081_1801 [Anaerovibrio sp. JC8]
MKYMNTSYMLFDMASNMKSLTKTLNSIKYPCFGGGDAKINLNAENTKLYVAFEVQYDYNTLYLDGYPMQIFMDDGGYGIVKPSTVQFYLKPSGNYMTLNINGKEIYKTPRTTENTWYRVYLVVDSVAGIVDLYLNGDKIYSYTSYVKTGVKATGVRLVLQKYNSYYVTMKNLIISDEYFPPNEEIVELPATVTADGWTYDSSSNKYSTEQENSTLTVTPDMTVLDGYKVTACNVGAGSTVLGDTIKNIKCDVGTYSNTKEIPSTGIGMYFDNLPTNISNITITAKK